MVEIRDGIRRQAVTFAILLVAITAPTTGIASQDDQGVSLSGLSQWLIDSQPALIAEVPDVESKMLSEFDPRILVASSLSSWRRAASIDEKQNATELQDRYSDSTVESLGKRCYADVVDIHPELTPHGARRIQREALLEDQAGIEPAPFTLP